MSKFIKSYLIEDFPEIKFFFNTTPPTWMVYIIPYIQLYYETNEPKTQNKFWRDGFSGIYLSAGWLRYTITLGFYKKIKNVRNFRKIL
jgi:hypothetical protein